MRCAATLCGPDRPALQLGLLKRPRGGSARLLLRPSPAAGIAAAAAPAAPGAAVRRRGRCCAVAACNAHGGSSGAVARSSSSSSSRFAVRAASAAEGSAASSGSRDSGFVFEVLASDPHPASASSTSVAAAPAADDTATPTPPAAATAADAHASGTVAGGSGPAAAAADALTAALSGVVGRVVDERLAAGLRGQLVGEVAAALAAEPRLLLGELLLTAAACKADSGAPDMTELRQRVSDLEARAAEADVGRLRAEVAELAAWRRGLEQWTPPEKPQGQEAATGRNDAAVVTPDTARCGLRVQRGPDWDWADSDGGAGGVGTVTQVMDNGGWCEVTWDATGGALVYRTGAYRRHDLQAVANQDAGLSGGPPPPPPPATPAATTGGGNGQGGGISGNGAGNCGGGNSSSSSRGGGSSGTGISSTGGSSPGGICSNDSGSGGSSGGDGGGRGTSGGFGGGGGCGGGGGSGARGTGGTGEDGPAGSPQRLSAAILVGAVALVAAAGLLICLIDAEQQQHQQQQSKQSAAVGGVNTAAAAAPKEVVVRKRDATLGILLPRYRPVPGEVVTADNVHVGLVVRRGPDWETRHANWIEASADGGPGSDGVVKEISSNGIFVWTHWPATGKDKLHRITGEKGDRELVVAPAEAQRGVK